MRHGGGADARGGTTCERPSFFAASAEVPPMQATGISRATSSPTSLTHALQGLQNGNSTLGTVRYGKEGIVTKQGRGEKVQ